VLVRLLLARPFALLTVFQLSASPNPATPLQVPFIIGALCSTAAVADLRRLNPFLGVRGAEEVLALAALTLCHASRIGHANRALADARKLRALYSEQARSPSDVRTAHACAPYDTLFC